ncbi:MAG: peptide chain release factor N(5)-glutamine methyltransferase [Bdellovibrionales bacterium]|nr:peptide chain release factor N(5)-glutamine methyltransferase [Bdellovibrionales bacterium]
MTLKDVLDKTTLFFKNKNLPSPRLDAELLLSDALNISRMEIYLKFDAPLKEQELEKCREHVRRRSGGEPVAYILGYKGFYGHDFFVEPGVLIPRPETEFIVDEIKNKLNKDDALNIIDLGCGSGCIGLSLKKIFHRAQVEMVDVSEAAVRLSEKNAKNLNAEVHILHKDVEKLELQTEHYDLVVSNPPYIAKDDKDVSEHVKEYEPHEALFAEEDGYYFLNSWAEKAFHALKPGGYLCMEMGYNQAKELKTKLSDLGYKNIEVIKDLASFDRVILAQK